MNLLRSLINYFWTTLLDYLFPRADEIKNLENMSAEEMRAIFPPAILPPHSKHTALFSYKHPIVKRALWEIKYNHNIIVADAIGVLLAEEILGLLDDAMIHGDSKSILLVPMPLHKNRREERGYNQCELLAESAMKNGLLNIVTYAPSLLYKIKETPQQSHTKNREERLKNLKDSFALSAQLELRGQTIILLDDVVTTGATFTEACTILEKSGTKRIFCIAIAH
ncbi:MAG: phosphoribosyltransferase family protein [Candidatus Paceibacterota bacterium]|jgi:ComF family protein